MMDCRSFDVTDIGATGRNPTGHRYAVVGAPLRIAGVPTEGHEMHQPRTGLDVLVVVREEPPHHGIVTERSHRGEPDPPESAGLARRIITIVQ